MAPQLNISLVEVQGDLEVTIKAKGACLADVDKGATIITAGKYAGKTFKDAAEDEQYKSWIKANAKKLKIQACCSCLSILFELRFSQTMCSAQRANVHCMAFVKIVAQKGGVLAHK